MTQTPYTPKPGSVAYRILGWLESQGETREFTSAQIAEALDIPAQTLGSYMEQSVAAGLVFRRQKDRTHQRAPVWWSLTNHGLRQRMEMSPNPVGWMTRPPKDDDEVPTFRGRATDTPKGDQPRSERGREVMEPAVCESADGRGTTGAPALATLPQHASPGVGPMGAGQPADAGPTTEARRISLHVSERRGRIFTESAAQQEAPPNPGSVEPAAPPAASPPAEQPRAVDQRFAAALDKAMQPQHVTAATFTLRCSGTLDIRADDLLLRLNDEQTSRLRRMLGGAA